MREDQAIRVLTKCRSLAEAVGDTDTYDECDNLIGRWSRLDQTPAEREELVDETMNVIEAALEVK